MTADVESLLLEHMKRFQATLDRVERKLSDLTVRAGNLESGQAAIIQHLAHMAATQAAQQLEMDQVRDRLDRIERRLDLAGCLSSFTFT